MRVTLPCLGLLCLSLLCAALPFGPVTARAATLYDELGGHDGVVRLVDGLFARALEDPRIKGVFAEANIVRLKRLSTDHLCQVTDGGCVYKGRDMRAAHRALGLTSTEFDAVAEDLQDAMAAQGIRADVQQRLLERLAAMREEVVSR